MKPTRILYINGGIMGRGGIESYMMNYYRNMDKSKIHLDFVVHGFEKGAYDEEIESLGGKIYRIPVKSTDYFGNISSLKKIFKEGSYEIVHSHLDAMSMLVLKIAKKYGIPIRIAHSHNTQHLTNNKFKILINEYARKNITKQATHYFACSTPAAKWLFGERNVKDNKIIYVKNAINLEKHMFSLQERIRVRDELNLQDSFVIGHIARFDYQKNHLFLLEVFKKLLNRRPDSKLVLVGDGHLRSEIEKKIAELKIEEKVILTGVRDDVHVIMNAFDVFCLPSHFEGLGIVLIEAQANGLKCVTSSNVPREADILNETKFIKLSENQETWVEALLKSEKSNRIVNMENFANKGYSISQEAEKLQNIYQNLINN